MTTIDDLRYLKEQYATDANLATRIRTHELYTEPYTDFTAWVLDHVPWQADERVLDVGCGAGIYVEPVLARTPHYIAGDLSPGMLATITAGSRVNLNAQRLPFASGAFDILLANHMIYHLPDRDQGVAEFSRVLRPGGLLLAATNSKDTMLELRELPVRVAEHLGISGVTVSPSPLDFTLENGAALLSRHFDHVERDDLRAALVFPSSQPVLDYLATSPRLAGLQDSVSTDSLWEALRQVLDAHIAAHGAFRVGKLTGLFRCWND